MKSYKEFLTELFDNPFDWRWTKNGDDTMYEAYFNSNENEFRVQITSVKQNGILIWDIGYEAKNEKGQWSPFLEVKENVANKILATIIEITKEFIAEQNPEKVIFTGDKNEIGRAEIYTKLLDRELPNYYDVEQKENSDNVEFTITKRDD